MLYSKHFLYLELKDNWVTDKLLFKEYLFERQNYWHTWDLSLEIWGGFNKFYR